MKKILYLLTFAIISINCKAQLTLVPIQDQNPDDIQSNTYLVDSDNLLNPYIGTWVYTNGTTSLKIVLRKEINNDNGYYREDLIYGEYQYIKDGIEKINTLPQIDVVFQIQKKHTIGGNYILSKNETTRCNDCEEDEKRLLVYMNDPLKETAANVVLRRIVYDGNPALSASILFDGIKETGFIVEETVTEYVTNTIANGNYILIKQP